MINGQTKCGLAVSPKDTFLDSRSLLFPTGWNGLHTVACNNNHVNVMSERLMEKHARLLLLSSD